MELIAQDKRDETWAPSEKKLARIAFDKAFERQCTAIIQEVRRMLETTTAPSDIFRVHEYLTEQKRIVDRVYDYRYSRLLDVFGRLLSDGWLREATLTVSNQRRLPKLNTKQVFLLRAIFSLAQSFSSAENRFDSDPIIHGLEKSLLASQVFFCGLHGDMSEVI